MADILFKKVDYTLKKLLEDIAMGEIGLPDIQRPFVWSMSKVRDLFDSMYRGYPIGYLLFWENGYPGEHRVIGVDRKQKVPRLLIVDGQQRLTSLYAVIKAVPVVDENFRRTRIRIAFNPLEEKFEVTNVAIERDVTWIADISELWKPATSTYAFIAQYLQRLKEKREATPDDEQQVAAAIDRLQKLLDYPVTALEISSSVDEDQVAEIFVRINSMGTPLNRADFILTLMSVFWDDGRAELEDFCRRAKIPPMDAQPSPFNYYLRPNPDQLRAGYPGDQLISSQMAVLYTYALWLIGKRDFGVSPYSLREVMARWFFMASLTGRYTSSPESRMEQDLALLRGAKTAADFVRILDQQIDAVLTRDYWEVTLPSELETAAPRNTGQSAYYAALCLLDAPVLYSPMKVKELLDPSTQAKKSALERHHLVPRHYLQRIGINDDRLINQVANYALVEWTDNIQISDRDPKEYVPRMEQRFSPAELRVMYDLHALPERWYDMDYHTFLSERRKRIADVIRRGFLQLKNVNESPIGCCP